MTIKNLFVSLPCMTRLNKKNMVIVQAWIQKSEQEQALRSAHEDDVSLSRWIRRAIKEKLIRDTPSIDKKL